MTFTVANRYTVLAVNDNKDFCECCGRKGLKRVVWILDTETGKEMHFGTTCALAPSKAFGVDKDIKSAIRKADTEIKLRASRARLLYKVRGGQYEQTAPGQWKAIDKELWEKCFADA